MGMNYFKILEIVKTQEVQWDLVKKIRNNY